ncbi:MAG: ABC transporter permease [Solirubrobacterales bacterium]|nr:ABC transporter permease [Solirubrobacterales bacterium]OJU93476.1 MAG: ABC transporter permease [Solirubrobacterales bacterium 67-14]
MPLSRRIERALPNALGIGLTGFVLVVLFGPVLLLALFSFNDSTVISLPWEGFTTRWYSEALNDDGAMSAIGHSLVVASVVTVASLILGTLASWGLTRIPFRGRSLVAGIHGAVLVVPWLIIGIAGLIFFSQIELALSLQTITLMHIVVTFPLVVAVVSAGLIRFDPSLEEAAIDMGASQLQMMRYVVLPQIAPSLAAAAIFAFAWSFNNFEISFFTGGFEQTFPVWVYGVLRHSSNLPVVNAASTIIALAQVLLVFGLWYGMKLMTKRRGGTDRDAAEMITGAVR